MEAGQSAHHEKCRPLTVASLVRHLSVIMKKYLGADSGFDGIRETQGACRGAVGLVKSRKKIVANDENFAPAALAA